MRKAKVLVFERGRKPSRELQQRRFSTRQSQTIACSKNKGWFGIACSKNIVMVLLIAGLLFIPLSSAYVFADGLDSLIEVGKSQGEIAREAAGETKNFEDIKRAVERGALKKGESKDDIESRYGEPVIILKDKDGLRKRWVYKRADESFFDALKIYLIFDDKDVLEDTKIADMRKPKKEQGVSE